MLRSRIEADIIERMPVYAALEQRMQSVGLLLVDEGQENSKVTQQCIADACLVVTSDQDFYQSVQLA